MPPDELAGRMGFSLRMVREMYYTNAWPHLRLNQRTVRFTESDYEQILELSEQLFVLIWTKLEVECTLSAL